MHGCGAGWRLRILSRAAAGRQPPRAAYYARYVHAVCLVHRIGFKLAMETPIPDGGSTPQPRNGTRGLLTFAVPTAARVMWHQL
jgi:hypothetical protein